MKNSVVSAMEYILYLWIRRPTNEISNFSSFRSKNYWFIAEEKN